MTTPGQIHQNALGQIQNHQSIGARNVHHGGSTASQNYIEEYGTDGMEYTPSTSSIRNTVPNGQSVTAYGSHGMSQLSHQQAQSNQVSGFTQLQNQQLINYQLSDPSSGAKDNMIHHESNPSRSGAFVNRFDAGISSNRSAEDPTEALLNQQYSQLQQEQLRPQRAGSTSSASSRLTGSNRIGNSFVQEHQIPQNSSFLNSNQQNNTEGQQNNLNISLNDVGAQFYGSQRSGGRNIPTPGFQSLNQSGAIPPQDLNQNNLPRQASSQNLVEQLSLKVKTQAERLQFLENYKTLCERRIRDFDQSHQLPVLPSHVGQRNPNSISSQNSSMTGMEGALQSKIQDLQNQLGGQQELKSRLSQAEESLRKETLQNEEQRAYIRVLREQLESKLSQMGLHFKSGPQGSTGFDTNVDGYLHLVSLRKQNADLQNHNQQLLTQLSQQQIQQEQSEQAMMRQFQFKVDELKKQQTTEVEALQARVKSIKDKKKLLKTDKNQLLDFVEESLHKQQAEEKIKQQLQEELKRKEGQLEELQSQFGDLSGQKKHQDDLLVQVQQNINKLREERDKLQRDHEQLKNAREHLEKLLADEKEIAKEKDEIVAKARRVANDLDRQLSEKSNEVRRLEVELGRKEREVECLLKGQQELTKEKASLIEVLRAQLDEQTKKTYQLEDANSKLDCNIQQTQKELQKIVSQYDLLNQSHKLQTSEFAVLKKQLADSQLELDNRTRTYNQLKSREDTLERELQTVYKTLSSKHDLVKDQEGRMQRTLREKDEEIAKIVEQYERLLAQSRDQTQRIEMLERLRIEWDKETDKLKNTVELKKNLVDDLQNQLIRTKADFENQHLTTQRHLNLAQNDLDTKEKEYSQKLQKALEDLSRVREQRQLAEKVLGENIEKNRVLEHEKRNLLDRVKWLEEELAKLDEDRGKEKTRKDQVQVEVERFRTERVDDALLIEQLRENLAQVRLKYNEIVGAMSAFSMYLDQLVSSDDSAINLATKDMTNLYEQINLLRVIQSDKEIPDGFKDLKDCISSMVTYTKNVSSQLKNAGVISGLNGFENTMAYIDHRKEDLTHSPPQKETWNIPQRISRLAQQHISNNPNATQGEINPDQSLVLGGNDQTQLLNQTNRQLQMTHENLKHLHDQLSQEKDKLSQLKNRLDLAELHSSLDKQHIEELENLLRKILSHNSSMDPKLKRVITDLFENSRDLLGVRYERANQIRSLTTKEQRYHTLNKAAASSGNSNSGLSVMPSYTREAGLLKAAIERERHEVKELELRVVEHQKNQGVLLEELQSLDQVVGERQYEQSIKEHGLQQENEEIMRALRKCQQDKEWAEKRYIDLEEQLNRFNMPLSLSRIDHRHEPESQKIEKNSGQIDNFSPSPSDINLPPNNNMLGQKINITSENSGSLRQLNRNVNAPLQQDQREGSGLQSNYQSQTQNQFKRNPSGSERKNGNQSQQAINIQGGDSISLENYAQKNNFGDQRIRNQSSQNQSSSLNRNQVISHFEPPRQDFNIHRTFSHQQSQEQSLQLPPPGSNYISRGESLDKNKSALPYQNNSLLGQYENYENVLSNYAPHRLQPSKVASIGSGLQYNNDSRHYMSYGDQNASASILKTKIQQVKTMFNQIRENI